MSFYNDSDLGFLEATEEKWPQNGKIQDERKDKGGIKGGK